MTSRGVNPSSRVLVIGGGYTGQRFAAAARARGAQVWLTSRSAQEEPHWLRFNAGEAAIPELPEALHTPTHLHKVQGTISSHPRFRH